ncbi:hypothetical protein C7974DRAFT_366825 [Boeremia exigua]|uniref:uncharacterized protein n=1 Tax=Boeremia exigua TaxID=749465 RepID=UPI001E8EEFED|nr:uncharacterized protein C7974DRAFT_366825 [Boeremia exigua]KAH6614894.1 hypothetical protein C7974DRAFT_366825 [Boeremia exigua]
MTSGSVFSGTLQTITNTKLEELSKQHSVFNKQYADLLTTAKEEQDPLNRLSKVVDGTKLCLSVKTTSHKEDDSRPGRVILGGTRNNQLETDLMNVDRFLDQARFDPSVSPAVLNTWEEKFMSHVTIQATKYRYAALYGKLVTEWLSSEKTVTAEGNVEMGESFEELPSAKKFEARREWEKSVFEPASVDLSGLEAYLERLFVTDKKKIASALSDLRKKVRDFETDLTSSPQFNEYTLRWVIKSLQLSGSLSNEKREVSGDFLSNGVILGEIADVLNMRLLALDRWSWGDHVLVEQRREINGRFQVHMHEDILQAIFLHFVGVKWSVFFKSAFVALRDNAETWKGNRPDVPKTDLLRREYFLGGQGQTIRGNLDSKRSRVQRKRYFTNKLLDFPEQVVQYNEGEEEADFGEFTQEESLGKLKKKKSAASAFASAPARAAPAGGLFGGAVAHGRSSLFMAREEEKEEEEEEEELDDQSISGDDESEAKNPIEAKQSLLHILATEIIINTRLNGEMTCFRTGFESWNPLLPHDTALTVLGFFGVSDKWKTFFKTYLEAPLKFTDDEHGPRLRRRGTPDSHALSDVFGEVLLFCLDFSVNQDTNGALLHRMYDDVWFWNKDYETSAIAWHSVRTFAEVTGTQISNVKSGSIRVGREGPLEIDDCLPQGDIRWGFLYLNPTNGRFDIDHKMVDSHAKELRQQLQGKTKSVIDWIQTWNSYATTFFSTNFGKAANCFGREHIDTMLATHRRIQETVFDGGNVVQYLKQMIHDRFTVSNLPDGFLYFPVELGGLELKSPFVGLLQIRDAVHADPQTLLDDYVAAEQDDYAAAQRRFDKGAIELQRRHTAAAAFVPDDGDHFLPFAEFARYRESWATTGSADLRNVYAQLLSRPHEAHVDPSVQVEQALGELGHGNLRGILANWYSMDAYWKWIAQMYGPDMIARFGSFNIVDPGWLPIGMVSQFRQRRTKWQG